MYEPDASDELPWPVPTTSTFAPAKGFPSLSLTVPEIDCANKKDVNPTKNNMNKGVRLEYGDSLMTHAMLFTGVDIKNGKPVKWRVENSWGNKSGDKGYYLMSNSWFNEYNYEVVIDKKYLTQKILNLFNKDPVKLDPWDPMGALAIK